MYFDLPDTAAAPAPTAAPTAAPTIAPAPTAAPTLAPMATPAATRAPAPTPTPTTALEPTATPRPTPTPKPRVALLRPEQTSPETDREALTALFNATDGESWDSTNSWLGRGSIGQWQGVTIDHSGRVTGLEVYGLSGKLPPELGNLTSLEILIIQGSQLNGGILPELGNLANLQWLDLRSNQLDGGIPSELGSLTKLRVLVLNDNQLRGELPRELGNLTGLQILHFNNNQLSGQIPPDLENLSLGSQYYVDLNLIIPDAWQRLPRHLDGGFSGNNFSGCVSDYFLEHLDSQSGLEKCPPPPDHPGDTETLIALYEAWGNPGWENWLGRAPIGGIGRASPSTPTAASRP